MASRNSGGTQRVIPVHGAFMQGPPPSQPHPGAAPKDAGISRMPGADPSAWISGLSFCIGIALAGPGEVVAEFAHHNWRFSIVAAAFTCFIALVILIQRHMRLSAAATYFDKPQALVTSGVFRYTRNPIYVLFLLPLASLAVYSLLAAAVSIAIYVIAMNRIPIAREERELDQIFGDEFRTYTARVPRWLF